MFTTQSDELFQNSSERPRVIKRRVKIDVMLSYYIVLFLSSFNEVFQTVMDLCSRESYIEDFLYSTRNVSDQNCGCYSCIRRCCKPGFIYRNQFCYNNSSDNLVVPIYKNRTILVNVLSNIEPFSVGVPNCVMFRLNFPDEEFYIQNDSKDVWVPTYNKFYNSNRYCVDELNGFTPFLCFSSSTRQSDDQHVTQLNTLGKNINSPKFNIIIFFLNSLTLEIHINKTLKDTGE